MSDPASNPEPPKGPGNPIPPRTPDLPTKIYSGGCHCGKYEFEIRHPVIEDGFQVVDCNCSLCIQRGYLLIYTLDPKNDFKLTKGSFEDFGKWRFNNKVADHVFCPVCGCGILIFEETGKIVGVNLRAVKGVDLDSLTRKKFDGRSIPTRD